jgi:hypothetical protein
MTIAAETGATPLTPSLSYRRTTLQCPSAPRWMAIGRAASRLGVFGGSKTGPSAAFPRSIVVTSRGAQKRQRVWGTFNVPRWRSPSRRDRASRPAVLHARVQLAGDSVAASVAASTASVGSSQHSRHHG